jgi:hypothetical protein
VNENSEVGFLFDKEQLPGRRRHHTHDRRHEPGELPRLFSPITRARCQARPYPVRPGRDALQLRPFTIGTTSGRRKLPVHPLSARA